MSCPLSNRTYQVLALLAVTGSWALLVYLLLSLPAVSVYALIAYDHHLVLCRTESLKPPPNGPVTWPSEQWTSMWKASADLRIHFLAAQR